MGHPGIYKMEQAPKKKEHVGVKKRALAADMVQNSGVPIFANAEHY